MAIPVLEPDEKLYSWLARTDRLNGYASAQAASTAFFRHPKAGLKIDFPSHLDGFISTLPDFLGTVHDIAAQATALPYLTRFRSSEVHDQAVRLMTGSSVAKLKFYLGLHASSHPVRNSLQICPDCFEAESERLGMPYWHRVHQLPGVEVCPEHEGRLRLLMCNLKDTQSSLYLPQDVYVHSKAAAPFSSPLAADVARRLARMTQAALIHPIPGAFHAKTMYFTYRHGLKNAGFLSPSGRIRAASLGRALSGVLSHLPGNMQLGRTGTKRDFELLLAILRGNVAAHPFPHLILIDFLFATWESFCGVYAWEHAMHRQEDEHTLRWSPSADSLENVSKSVDEATANAEDISNEKLLRHRSALSAFMNSHPDASRSRIASLCTASWKWLYRNDRLWLNKNLPEALPNGRYYDTWVNWEERDLIVCCQLVAHGDAIRFTSSERITVATLLRKLPPVGFSFCAAKMPQAAKVFENMVQQHRTSRRQQRMK